jgi:hypothetical protein
MSELASQIQSLLEEEARAALEAGWAEVTETENVAGLTLRLEPIKLDAAPLEVHFDSDQLVMCSPGRNNMVVEFFSEDPEEIKRGVRALAAAVVAGGYGERKKDGTTELEAEWPSPGGVQRATRSLLAVPGAEKKPWREVGYAPYS